MPVFGLELRLPDQVPDSLIHYEAVGVNHLFGADQPLHRKGIS
jgi:hypothetical protein